MRPAPGLPPLQVRLVLQLLEENPGLPLLVVADSDTAWLRQPWTFFERRPGAEFFISSDCLSVEVGWAGRDARLPGALQGAGRAWTMGDGEPQAARRSCVASAVHPSLLRQKQPCGCCPAACGMQRCRECFAHRAHQAAALCCLLPPCVIA